MSTDRPMTPETKPLALRVADELMRKVQPAFTGDDEPAFQIGTEWITYAEARALAALLREAGGWRPKYFLSRDNDSHWYVVPVANAAEWEDWVAVPEDDERAWDVPAFAHPIGGAPCLVTFTAPEVEGRPLPAPPATGGA